jgi:hypothetical protein
MKNLVLIAATVLALSACGGSGSSGADAGATGGSNTGASMFDAFTSFVASLVGTTPDNTEPVSTDSVGLTTSDTTEPAKIQ